MSVTLRSQLAEWVTQCSENCSDVILALLQLLPKSDQNTHSSASSFVNTVEVFWMWCQNMCVQKPYHCMPLSDHLQDPHCDLYEPPHLHKLCLASCRRNAKMPRLKTQYLVPSLISSLTDEMWQDIWKEFSQLLPQPSIADIESEGWQHGIQSGAVKASNLQEAYEVVSHYTCVHCFSKQII